MIEDVLGRFGLPATLVVIALIGAILFNNYDSRHTKNDLRIQVVKVCGNQPNMQTCATNLINTLAKVK